MRNHWIKSLTLLCLVLTLLSVARLAEAQVNNLGPGSLTGAATVQAVWSATSQSSGTNNAQIVTTTTGNFTLQAGNAVTFIPGVTNTGSATVNVDGQGAVQIHVNGASAPAGSLVLGQATMLVYNGSTFDLVSTASLGSYGALLAGNNLSDVASAATSRTNLGLASAATVNIGTSGATIPLNNGGFTQSGPATFIGGLFSAGRTITSGATDTASSSDFEVRWNKTVGSASAETVPACNSSNDKFIIVITDEKGDAATNNITVTPAAGTILTQSGYLISVNYGSVTLHCDGANSNYTVI